MAVDIIVPTDLWDGDVQGIISAWLYADGDFVPDGAVIAEVMVEKVSHDLVTPAMGNLTILVPAEQPLDRGAIVGRVG